MLDWILWLYLIPVMIGMLGIILTAIIMAALSKIRKKNK